MEKQTLIDLLSKKQLKVAFVKKDESVRAMFCTRAIELIPEEMRSVIKLEMPAEECNIIPVFDLEAKGIRTVNYGTLIVVTEGDKVIFEAKALV